MGYTVKVKGKTVFDKIALADNFFSRFMGLMGKRGLNDGEGVFFTKTNQIHTNFMRFDIDVIYLDKTMKILYIECVKPWRIGKRVKGTVSVMEVSKGKAGVVSVGDTLELIKN